MIHDMQPEKPFEFVRVVLKHSFQYFITQMMNGLIAVIYFQSTAFAAH